MEWHTCAVPVAGDISPVVDSALRDMTALTGITFTRTDWPTAAAHGITFVEGDLAGAKAGEAAVQIGTVGEAKVVKRATITWDPAFNPPPARIARHELGHTMGLAHSTTAVMRPQPSSTTWTAAERAYLADVGRATGCRS